MAAAAAAGIFIGVIGYHVVSYKPDTGRTLDSKQISGTMGLPNVDDTGPAMRIDLPAAIGTFAVERDGAHIRSRLDVTSESDIDVIIDYAGEAVRYGGGDLAGGSSNQITVEDHGVRVRNRGAGTYFFLFQLPADPATPMVVKILAENNVLLEETVHPERAPKKE
jgi:hypothetical protein